MVLLCIFIFQDYFVLLPNEYKEPSILKEDVYEPCLAGEISAYCRHYSYPNLAAFPITYSTNAERPGGSGPYTFQDDKGILSEMENPTLAEIAKYQDELEYPMELDQLGKHVLAVVFFTPEGANGDGMQLDVVADTGGIL